MVPNRTTHYIYCFRKKYSTINTLQGYKYLSDLLQPTQIIYSHIKKIRQPKLYTLPHYYLETNKIQKILSL